MYHYLRHEGYVFGLSVCLSVSPTDYLKSNEQISVTLLSNVCLGPRKTDSMMGMIRIVDTDYDEDPLRIVRICMQLITELCLVPKTNPLHIGMIRIRIRIHITIINLRGGFQSLTAYFLFFYCEKPVAYSGVCRYEVSSLISWYASVHVTMVTLGRVGAYFGPV